MENLEKKRVNFGVNYSVVVKSAAAMSEIFGVIDRLDSDKFLMSCLRIERPLGCLGSCYEAGACCCPPAPVVRTRVCAAQGKNAWC